MSDEVYLEAFSTWLGSLATDAQTLSEAMLTHAAQEGEAGQGASALVGGINYLFKSLDLIPDGIEDLGYLDDAFVLRVAARHAKEAGVSHEGVSALAAQTEVLEEFLGPDYQRLDAYVTKVRDGSVRGRTPALVLADETIRRSLASELSGWSAQYQVPSFTMQPRTLVKLRAFLGAKLP